MADKAQRLPLAMAERIELWELGQLVEYSGNARQHSAAQVRQIADSIRTYGFLNPIIVDQATRTIRAGHGRLLAARLLGLERVPVVPVSHLSEELARAYVIADNRLAELATWDERKLAGEVRALAASLPELPVLGFSVKDLERMLAPAGPTPATADDTQAPPERPATRRGDVWLLGGHRLLCADRSDAKARGRLLAGQRPACIVTDPPYAIFGSSTGVGGDVADDRMVRKFFEDVLRSIAAALPVGRHGYVFCDWRSWASWWEAQRGTGVSIANMVVWSKRGGLGNNWQNTHELVAFFHRLNDKRSTWNKEPKGVRPVLKPNVITIGRAGIGEFERSEPSTTRTVTAHNAAKPVDLLRELIQASTDDGERVLDLFGGSGSTLLACEVSKRLGLAVEIEPKWCDVAVRRWQALTSKRATLEGDGREFDAVAAARSSEAAAPRRRKAAKS